MENVGRFQKKEWYLRREPEDIKKEGLRNQEQAQEI
jgi:hypothetical protein